MHIVILCLITLLIGFIIGVYVTKFYNLVEKSKDDDDDDADFWKKPGNAPGYADQSDLYE